MADSFKNVFWWWTIANGSVERVEQLKRLYERNWLQWVMMRAWCVPTSPFLLPDVINRFFTDSCVTKTFNKQLHLNRKFVYIKTRRFDWFFIILVLLATWRGKASQISLNLSFLKRPKKQAYPFSFSADFPPISRQFRN